MQPEEKDLVIKLYDTQAAGKGKEEQLMQRWQKTEDKKEEKDKVRDKRVKGQQAFCVLSMNHE